MFNKIKQYLKTKGFIYKADITENELNELIVETFGDLDAEARMGKAELKEVYDDFRKVENLGQLLRAHMASDIKRYFNAASPMEQLTIKGQFNRTAYLLGQYSKSEEKQPVGKPAATRVGTRYASSGM